MHTHCSAAAPHGLCELTETGRLVAHGLSLHVLIPALVPILLQLWLGWLLYAAFPNASDVRSRWIRRHSVARVKPKQAENEQKCSRGSVVLAILYAQAIFQTWLFVGICFLAPKANLRSIY